MHLQKLKTIDYKINTLSPGTVHGAHYVTTDLSISQSHILPERRTLVNLNRRLTTDHDLR